MNWRGSYTRASTSEVTKTGLKTPVQNQVKIAHKVEIDGDMAATVMNVAVSCALDLHYIRYVLHDE